MSRGGATATTDDTDPHLRHELTEMTGEILRSEVVGHLAVDDPGKTGIRDRRNRRPRVAGQMTQGLVHLGGTGGAVEPDDVGVQRLQGRQRRTDLGARQHPAGELDRDLDLERQGQPCGSHRPPRPFDRSLGSEEVELGLDDQEVDTPVDQRSSLYLVGGGQLSVRDLAQSRELGPGADGSGDETLSPVGGDVAVDRLPGENGTGSGDLIRLVLQPVLGERHCEGPECVGLHHIDPDVEERSMEGADDVGPPEVQQLVAPFQGGPPEVVRRQAHCLQIGAGRPVVDDHPGFDGIEIPAHRDGPGATVRRPRVPRCMSISCKQLLHKSSALLTDHSSFVSLETLEERREPEPQATHRSRHWHRACAGCRGFIGPDPSTAHDERFVSTQDI